MLVTFHRICEIKGWEKKVCNNGLEKNVLLSAQELPKNMGMEGDRTKDENLKVV